MRRTLLTTPMMLAGAIVWIVATSMLSIPALAFSTGAKDFHFHAHTSRTPLFSTDAVVVDAEILETKKAPGRSIVEQCYAAWNRRDMKAAADCFADGFTYDDGQFLGTIRNNKSLLQARFRSGANILPPNSRVVVDALAVCPTTKNIGARWHVETLDGTPVPLTNGCSFYTVDSKTGLIRSGFKVTEMLVKPSKDLAGGLVSSASRFLRTSNNNNDNNKRETPETPSLSIIEQYFCAWNDRDMEGALDCFVDDCVYETEDPVFVDKFVGKEALREHLVQNAAALPSSCSIILDDLAMDDTRGAVGVRWHLEANGIAIPNLRGCSMYTLDSEKGLLKTGYDVTEAPVKVPDVAQTLLSALPISPFQ